MRPEITQKTVLASVTGGILDYVDDETGEVLFSVPVPPGLVPARQYLALAEEGQQVEVAEGLVVIQPKGGFGRQPYGRGSHDSGANPDYRPTSASRLEREMRVTIGNLQQVEKRMVARERALAAVERIPTAPAPASTPVAPVPTQEAGEALVE